MIRLFLLLLFIYLVARVLFRIFAGPWRAFQSKLFSSGPSSRVRRAGTVVDEMRPCAQCGTFTPSLHAYRKKGLYFCNRQCHEAYLKKESA